MLRRTGRPAMSSAPGRTGAACVCVAAPPPCCVLPVGSCQVHCYRPQGTYLSCVTPGGARPARCVPSWKCGGADAQTKFWTHLACIARAATSIRRPALQSAAEVRALPESANLTTTGIGLRWERAPCAACAAQQQPRPPAAYHLAAGISFRSARVPTVLVTARHTDVFVASCGCAGAAC